ncbi:MAG TPA: hypothetical protein VEJ45_05925 [Candidatus Acidoferrales bacterium]|nr:hypothetical protein [Candidatus Acidoferrales bacterium]
MVQVISLESVPLIERPHVREGVFQSRRILNGVSGTPGNFSLQLGVTPSYYSPRHRHNFDQVRYQIEGEFDFAADGVMKPGSIAYFPEGTYYGPQASAAANSTLVLQFGGASRSGYISPEQYEKASAELSRHGTFAKGVYTRLTPDGGKTHKDGYEAVWEEVNGRPLVYPRERYLRPVFMDPESFHWTPLANRPGVSWKHLGQFSECRTRIVFFKIAPGATLDLEENSIYFVTHGLGSVSAACASATDFERQSTIYLAPGDHATLRVNNDEPSELLHIGLPHFP